MGCASHFEILNRSVPLGSASMCVSEGGFPGMDETMAALDRTNPFEHASSKTCSNYPIEGV